MTTAIETEVRQDVLQAKPDPRFDSFAHAGFYGRVKIIQRACLSFIALVGFLLIPGIKRKARYTLALAGLPMFREFHFFRVMHRLVDEAAKQGRAS